jgi:hypothetical protein
MAGLVPAIHVLILSKQRIVEIFPIWIELVNQPHLPGAGPVLDNLFTPYRIAHVVKNFVVDERLETIPLL